MITTGYKLVLNSQIQRGTQITTASFFTSVSDKQRRQRGYKKTGKHLQRQKTPPVSLSKVGNIEIIIRLIISLDNIHYISSHYIQVGIYKTVYGCIQK